MTKQRESTMSQDVKLSSVSEQVNKPDYYEIDFIFGNTIKAIKSQDSFNMVQIASLLEKNLEYYKGDDIGNVRKVTDMAIGVLQSGVIASKNPEDVYYFAKNVRTADIELLQQAVIDSGSSEWAYWFAHDIPGADIKALKQAIASSKDAESSVRLKKLYDYINQNSR